MEMAAQCGNKTYLSLDSRFPPLSDLLLSSLPLPSPLSPSPPPRFRGLVDSGGEGLYTTGVFSSSVVDHTMESTPDPIRFPKLSSIWPA